MTASVHRLPTSGDGTAVTNPRGQLRKAYKPNTQVVAEWKREGKRRSDVGYSARWTAFWGRTVRALASLGSVAAADMVWVDEYVRRCRLAELHRFEAEQEPYATYDSGYVAAHPGFAQSRAEAKEARQLALELGLTPAKRREAGIDLPRPDAPGTAPDSGSDDQIGPDGEPL